MLKLPLHFFLIVSLGATSGFENLYSKPQKVGNRIKGKSCWDSLYTLRLLDLQVVGFYYIGLHEEMRIRRVLEGF